MQKHLLPLNATQPLRVLLVAIAGDPDRTPGRGVGTGNSLALRFAGRSALRYALLPRRIRENAAARNATTWRSRRCSCAWPIAKAAWDCRRAGGAGGSNLLAGGKPAIVACFGSPYVIERFPKAPTWLAAFSTADVAEVAMGRALFGEMPIGGRLPVSVPGAKPALAVGAGLKLAADPMKLASSDTRNGERAGAGSLKS